MTISDSRDRCVQRPGRFVLGRGRDTPQVVEVTTPGTDCRLIRDLLCRALRKSLLYTPDRELPYYA